MKTVPASWVSVAAAAEFLGLPVRTLRRTLERNSERGPTGGTEALVDGVRGRKFGHLWRVQFDECWLTRRAATGGSRGTVVTSPERSGMPERNPA